eukprot:376374_1
MNWSQIAAPPKQQQPRSKPPQPRPQPQSESSNNRTQNRKNRKKKQKQLKQQWPTLNNNTTTTTNPTPNKSQNTKNNNNNSISFASLTSKTQKFASTSNPHDTMSISSTSSYHTNNTTNNTQPSINKQELQKKIQQHKFALNTLKKQYITKNQTDIFSQLNSTIYGIRNRGIRNRNVDCYINAIIQSILSLPLVVTLFSTIKSAKIAAQIGPFTKALYDTIHLFTIASNNSNRNHKNNSKKQMDIINYNHTNYSNINHPKSLIGILNTFRHSMGIMGNGQQDAQEFLGYILTNIHDEMTWDIAEKNKSPRLTRKQRKALREQQQNDTENEIKEEKKEDNGWNLVTKNIHHKASVAHRLKMDKSLIAMLFGGEFYQMIRGQNKGKKGKPSVSYQPFFSISLDINDRKIKTVSGALQNYFSKPHVIEYKNGNANKSELISESPYYLILHLKRFLFENGQIYKLNKYIGYDTKLTISQHLLFDKNSMKICMNKNNKLKYELRSVIVHEGDFVTHGHYNSYCRREDFYINKINKNKLNELQKQNEELNGKINLYNGQSNRI